MKDLKRIAQECEKGLDGYRRASPETLALARKQAGKARTRAEAVDILRSVMLEGDRIDLAHRIGMPPEACGCDAPVAPARGAVLVVETVVIADDGTGKLRTETAGYRGRRAFRAADALDRITALSEAQRAAGRRYAAVAEVVAAGGMKRSSLYSDAVSGTDEGRDWMDVYIGHCERLRRMHRAIGDGVGMAVRRVRPSARGTKASIADRKLVDMVCLGQSGLVPVLEAHGWVNTGRNVRVLSEALAAILQRLRDV